MKFNVCVIDDKIPANNFPEIMDDKKMLNHSNLKFLIKQDCWDELSLKTLVEDFVINEQEWNTFAFTNPEFYISDINENYYSPDLIVYDWDYPIGNPGKYFMDILKHSYSYIGIYTAADQDSQVTNLINGKDFENFKNRFEIIHKDDENSHKKLYKLLQDSQKEYFSFKFGKELRLKSNQALNSILVELGKLNIDETIHYFSVSKDSNNELIDFLTERFRNILAANVFDELPKKNRKKNLIDESIAEKLWSYRLYYKSNDNFVKKGDIVQSKTNIDKLYLIISADCDLERFWGKNLGQINYIPLYNVHKNRKRIKELGELTKNRKALKNIEKITSISNKIDSIGGNLLYFPFVNVNGEYEDYIAFPKEINSKELEMHKSVEKIQKITDRNVKLLYTYWHSYKKIATICEPFLSPIIEHVMTSIKGYCSPDFSPNIQSQLANKFKNINVVQDSFILTVLDI